MSIKQEEKFVKKNAYGFWIVLYNARYLLDDNPYVLPISVS